MLNIPLLIKTHHDFNKHTEVTSAEFSTKHYKDFTTAQLYTLERLYNSPQCALSAIARQIKGSMVTPALGTQDVRLGIARLL